MSTNISISIFKVEIKQGCVGNSIPCPYKTAIIGSFEVPGTGEISTSLDIKNDATYFNFFKVILFLQEKKFY